MKITTEQAVQTLGHILNGPYPEATNAARWLQRNAQDMAEDTFEECIFLIRQDVLDTCSCQDPD